MESHIDSKGAKSFLLDSLFLILEVFAFLSLSCPLMVMNEHPKPSAGTLGLIK